MKQDKQSRTPLVRMMRIHQQLIEGEFPNTRKLAEELEVSRKTIQRDVEYMRDQMKLPIDYDGSRHGFYYTREVTSFPTILATEGEVLALFVAEQALQQYRGTPFEQPLASAFAKLAQVMGKDISVDLEQLNTALSFRHTGLVQTDLEVFRVVTQALMDSRELTFRYLKLNAVRPSKRRVRPCHVANIDGQWYLFAYDLERKDIRTFVIARIQDAPEVGGPFEKMEDFSLTEHLLNTFGVFKGEGKHVIRIEFDSFAARLIRERTWHPSQEIHELDEGRIELRMQLGSLEEIERWVLSWGSRAKVIGPPQLKQRVKESLRDMQTSYSHMPLWYDDLREAQEAYQSERLLDLAVLIDRMPDDPNQMQLEWENNLNFTGN